MGNIGGFIPQTIYLHPFTWTSRSQWVCEGVPLDLIYSELIYSERLFGPLIFGHAHIKRCWKQLVQSLCHLHSCKLTWLLEHPHVQYQNISSNGGFSVVMLVFVGHIRFLFSTGKYFGASFRHMSFLFPSSEPWNTPPSTTKKGTWSDTPPFFPEAIFVSLILWYTPEN